MAAPHDSYGVYVNKPGYHGLGDVDNAVYGSPGNSDFNGISSQTYIVQAACRYIWEKSTGLDGI